jgi:hypothetical protein
MALAKSLLSTSLLACLGEIGLGGAAVLGFGFEFAICSKCERREDTGFCTATRCQHHIKTAHMEEKPTIDVPSRFSSPDSSIVQTNKDKIQLR